MLHDLTADRQPQARSLRARMLVSPLPELLEYRRLEIRRDPRPVVADRNANEALLRNQPHLHASILQRHELQRSATSASRLVRDNEARTALLSAVSHDLRTPLAGIKAAIGSLRSSEMRWSKEDEDELK